MTYKYLDNSIFIRSKNPKNFDYNHFKKKSNFINDKTESNSEYYPSEFKKIKPLIYEIFSYQCFICKNEGSEVHHIDYNTMNNKKNNLILLCKSCHAKTNSGRTYWENKLKKDILTFWGKEEINDL